MDFSSNNRMYHSAIKSFKVYGGEPTQEFICSNGKAFVNNICDSIPVFPDVDVVYSEPAWMPGYKVFKQRAGGRGADSYKEYVNSINEVSLRYSCPVYLMCSKQFLKYARRPFGDLAPIVLTQHNVTAYLLAYNATFPFGINTDTVGFIGELSKIYNCIYDFSCGYADPILEKFHNKKFYLSDIDSHCVGYIRDHYNWLQKGGV